ncbi:MAG TPA: ABC transporter substrate-binding protein [Acidimicrobiia bacterium]|jgi:ABC-type branched-subunit amino acid transport system substrate-binding protein|nr:ABC transporter substrate-binding protein [Acidimicrobiia bacterium]
MKRLALLILAVGLLATACSDGDDTGQAGTTLASTATTSPTTTTTTPATTTTAAPAESADEEPGILTDGVTVTNDTIYVGILADLSGPFSGNVIDLVDSQLAFWAAKNAAGGIAGRQVELLVVDTAYDLGQHQLLYGNMVNQVVMFSHSTGSPHTASIADDLVRDQRLAIPVGWYSGWSDPGLGANLLELGSNYCIEATNAVSFLSETHQQQFGELPTIAIATDAGDYGQDSAAGAKFAAAQLGVDIAFDGEATLAFGGDPSATAAAIAASGADYTWVATDPITAAELVSQSLSSGYRGGWSGATPSFSPRLLDTALGDYLSQAWLVSVFFAPAGADVPGMSEVYAVLAESFPDRFPSDGLVRGYLEFSLTAQVLERAAALGDLTPAGVVDASKQIGDVDFGGISPTNLYTGDFNTSVARQTGLYRASKALFESQGGLGAVLGDGAVSAFEPVAPAYVSEVAANMAFDEPCYVFGS